MISKFTFNVFILCLFVWTVQVDNAYIPKNKGMKIKPGTYSRYKVKDWGGEIGKYDFLQNELLVYAYDLKGKERLFYMDYKPYFESTLKSIPKGASVNMHYAQSFPKFWKKELYELRVDGLPVFRFSSAQLYQKQIEVYKITGIMLGIFLILSILGYVTKFRPK